MRRVLVRLKRKAVGLGAVVLVGGGVVTSAPAAASALPANLEVIGHGWGHGRGMGQYGALGYALQYGWTYQQILSHFYGGTTLAAAPVASLTVQLSELTGSTSVSVSAPQGSQLMVDGKAAGATATLTPGQSVTSSGGADVIVAGPWSNGPSREFAGQLVFKPGSSGQPSQVDNVVSLDQYVEGVVPRESPASWPLAALEAQAVAARSYALAYTGNGAVPICDTPYCQVYGGDPAQYGAGADASNSNAAVTDTAGQVLECGTDSACGAPGAVALTEYSSSTGGYTAGGAFPAVPDAGDATPSNPNHDWSATLSSAEVQSAFPSVGTLETVTVISRNGDGDLGGRVEEMELTGSAGYVKVSGSQFAAALGLKSNWFVFTNVAPPGSDTGYWVVASSGAVYPFGSAPSYGSMAGHTLNAPVIGMAPTGDGAGYWLVAGDGGIFSFGDARFYGSTGGIPLVKPVVAMARTPDGRGYWLVASDGGVFSFGDAKFYGSAASLPLAAPIVGMVPTADGRGYWLVASDGGVFAYGDAGFVGSLGGSGVTDVQSVTPTPDGKGYLLVTRSGHVYPFGDATYFGDPATSLPGWSGSALGIFARG